MPLQTLRFKPGIVRESTTLANEGGWFECDKIRFRSGQPEKLGGWVRDTGVTASALAPATGSYWGIARALRNWTTLSGVNLLGVGTELKYYIQSSTNGYFYDVTPIRLTTAAGAVTFAATAGSSVITVTHTAHGAQTGDFVTFSGAVSLGGNITAALLNAEFQVAYLTADTYSITVGATAVAGDSGNGGASVVAQYQINTGQSVVGTASGWGASGWGGILPASGAAATTLNGAINDSVSSITLTNATTFSTTGTIIVDSELITYTGKSTNTLTGCTRGASGTLAASHSNGAVVTQVTSAFSGWGQSASAGLVSTPLQVWSTGTFGENLVMNLRRGPLYYWDADPNPNVFSRAKRLTYQTFTVTIASPAVVTFSEPIADGTQITLSTTGALPTGLVSGGSYYVVNGNNLASTYNGTPIITSGTQSGTHSLLVTDCPTVCNYVLVSDSSRFIITFGVNDYGSSTQDPLLIRWSDQESYNTWYPQATNQAGSYRLGIGSEIITAQQTRQEILVWTDAALYSMQYIGPPYVWGVQLMASNLTIVSQNAAATAGNVTYWMGHDKFYMYSGQMQPLNCTLLRYVYNDINLNQRAQFFAGTNEGFSEIWWFYCSSTSNTIDRYIVYNYLENIWYYGTLARTAWLDSTLRIYPIAAGYNGQILYHENGIDDGTTTPPSAISSYIQSSDFDIGDGHNYGFVWRIIPDVTFDGSTSLAPQVNFSVLPRRNPGAAYGAATNPVVVSGNNYVPQRTYLVQKFTEIVYPRIRGRQMALRLNSDQLGTQWQFGAPRIDVRPDGRSA